MRYSLNQFVALFNDEDYNQLWSKYILEDNCYDFDDTYIAKRVKKEAKVNTILPAPIGRKYRLSKLVKLFNSSSKKIFREYCLDYDNEGCTKLYEKG